MRMTVIHSVGVISGSLFHSVTNPCVSAIGAQGGIYALFGKTSSHLIFNFSLDKIIITYLLSKKYKLHQVLVSSNWNDIKNMLVTNAKYSIFSFAFSFWYWFSLILGVKFIFGSFVTQRSKILRSRHILEDWLLALSLVLSFWTSFRSQLVNNECGK